MSSYLMVFIGGGLGSMLRLYFQNIVITRMTVFPFGTLLANIISSFILGILMFLFINKQLESREIRLLLAVGFCGGFSTFSTFSYENFALLQDGRLGMAFLNMGANLTLCLLLVAAGSFLSRMTWADGI